MAEMQLKEAKEGGLERTDLWTHLGPTVSGGRGSRSQGPTRTPCPRIWGGGRKRCAKIDSNRVRFFTAQSLSSSDIRSHKLLASSCSLITAATWRTAPCSKMKSSDSARPRALSRWAITESTSKVTTLLVVATSALVRSCRFASARWNRLSLPSRCLGSGTGRVRALDTAQGKLGSSRTDGDARRPR